MQVDDISLLLLFLVFGPFWPSRYEHVIHKLRYELNAEARLLDSPASRLQIASASTQSAAFLWGYTAA